MTASQAENLSGNPAASARVYPEQVRGRTTHKAVRRTLLIGLALLAIALLVWIIRPTSHSHTGASRWGSAGPIPVGVAKVRSGNVRLTLDALGTVTPLATVTVKPEVSGIIQKINFREGQMVRAGDVLAEIDPRPYQAALDQAKGALARDQAQYANALIDLQRYQSLWAKNAISQQILATQEATVRTDAGTVEADKGALEAAAVNLAFCKITSPVAGEVGLRQIDVGNYVQTGVTTEIVVVTQLQPMSVLFTLPEDDIDQVMGRVHAGAKLPADAYDRSQTTKIASGTLSTIDNEIDPTTGMVKLRALFDNSDDRLFPSQFVNIRLLVDTLHGRTTVPGAAVQHGASGSYVFVVKPGDTVRMQSVALGPTDGDSVEVTHGIAPGEEVVVDGTDKLRDGSQVTIPGNKNTMSKSVRSSAGFRGHGHHHHHWSDSGNGGQ
ncbi:MAG TPA: efflux RND transporter periplasmic adaptor subunit [Rhizomicrobium sp.]|nr:efflux RND transporter periplasmic adaptor subunit [Rhizomicrobium sp.]